MKQKALILSFALGLTLAGGGGAAAYLWYMNRPEQIMARAQQHLAENRPEEAAALLNSLAAQSHTMRRINRQACMQKAK